MDKSDCQNIREMLDPYLDNELLVETSQAVLDHLSFCSECAAESERRIELGRLVKTALTLKDHDEIDSETLARRRIKIALDRERHPRARAKVRWFALAAGVILTLTLGAVYWRIRSTPYPTNSSVVDAPVSATPVLIAAIDRDAVESHQACALSYPPNWAFDLQRVERELTPRFAPLIESIRSNQASYDLIEGHICRYQQRQYAHLILRGNGHTISVFIENDDPGDPKSSGPPEIDQASYKAYQVARVDTGLHHIFVVSDLTSGENLALANQLFPSTLGFVRELEGGAS